MKIALKFHLSPTLLLLGDFIYSVCPLVLIFRYIYQRHIKVRFFLSTLSLNGCEAEGDHFIIMRQHGRSLIAAKFMKANPIKLLDLLSVVQGAKV